MEQSDDFGNYGEFDYQDAFFTVFRQWMKTNVPESEQGYPISYLIQKYSKKFVRELASDSYLQMPAEEEDWSIDRWRLQAFIRDLVKSGKHKMPSKRQDKKFTEKYARHINYFMEENPLPSWVKVSFEELNPYSVKLKSEVNYPELLKDRESETFSAESYRRKFQDFVENFLGVEIGNPIHGQLDLDNSSTELVGADTWVKNVLNKQIKPMIKQTELGKKIKAIQFKPHSRTSEMKVIFNTNSWGGRSDVMKKIKEIIEELGYNSKRFSMDY